MLRSRRTVGVALAGSALLPALLVAGPAHAAESIDTLDCGSYGSLVIRTHDNNSSDHGGWSTGQVVGGTAGQHLIPVVFHFQAEIVNGPSLGDFTEVKGNGHADNQQQTVTCTETFGGTVADFFAPDPVPAELSAFTDSPVSATFTVTAVPKP